MKSSQAITKSSKQEKCANDDIVIASGGTKMAYLCKVEICGVDTSKLPVLNSEQMLQLFRQYQNGDDTARETLIYSNLRLVLSVIQRFGHRGENPDDLFQVGCIGLIKALDNFDLSHGVKFSTYAVPMIIGEVRRYLRDNNSIRVSRSLRDIAYKALQARDPFRIAPHSQTQPRRLAGTPSISA